MLGPINHILKNRNIVLASGSPRRKEILEKNLGLNIQIIPSTFPENLDKSKYEPASYVMENSRLKALDVASGLKEKEWFLIIGSDTVVVKDNKIFEKPIDKADAFRILKNLSNNTHKVLTGVTLVKNSINNNDDFKVHSFYEETDVTFADLDDDVINSYIDSGDPMDKAGGYGIQSLGSSLVKSINGDFFNVQGFPCHKFATELRKFIQ
ncbi:unnamed protein product [Brachionus calyciflorus]|uniref:Uncharacterized protein n=1 Tax=Brachionus calyciflorus TaxID=104777 RepID=A0A813Q1X4_9BILA|nr:unnamed protein product [Brachionus calyciflorus]